ncbi:TPA: methylisocitrate lyase [Candidatus Geothermarchaeota archaeon]|nr:methylisocitrate lyase [Candidatus Geothermarchaeota archaeon]
MIYIKSSRDAKPILRELIEDSNTYMVPGVYNPFTALLAEKMGFKAIYLSGAALTGSLAMPDLGLITLSELTFFTKYIARAVDIPLLVDADTGFGEVLNVARAVRELEDAGASAIQIEDQVLPKKCGHLRGKQLINPIDMARKIRSAVSARRSRDFLIIARTDARNVSSLEDALERSKLYVEAGADIIFPEALESIDEFRVFVEEIDAPILANMTEFGRTPYISYKEFREIGVKFIIYPVTIFRGNARNTLDILKSLREYGGQEPFLEDLMTRKEFYDLIGYSRYEDFDEELSRWKP